MMLQFEVMTLSNGGRFLLCIDNSHYDNVWGFYRPIKRLED